MNPDRELGERLHAADSVRPVPSGKPWSAADLDRLLRRRRVHRFARAGLLLCAIASLAIWCGRPQKTRADETVRAPRYTASPLDAVSLAAAGAIRESAAAMRRARLSLERTAMASLCFGEALADIDGTAGRRQQDDVARLFPDTIAVRDQARPPGANR